MQKEEFKENKDFELFFIILKALFIKESIYGFAKGEWVFQKKDYLEVFFENQNCSSFAFVCCNTKKISEESATLEVTNNLYAKVNCYASISQNNDYEKVKEILYEVNPESLLKDTFDYTKKLHYENPTET